MVQLTGVEEILNRPTGNGVADSGNFFVKLYVKLAKEWTLSYARGELSGDEGVRVWKGDLWRRTENCNLDEEKNSLIKRTISYLLSHYRTDLCSF